MKKIYFAGSIRGGRQDAELYGRIISRLKEYGYVLTEHVGNAQVLELEKDNSAESIYARDMAWMFEADILIAEATNPSLGAGYEIARAEERNIPVHIFYNKKRCSLSAMLAGNAKFFIHPYENEDEIYAVLKELFL